MICTTHRDSPRSTRFIAYPLSLLDLCDMVSTNRPASSPIYGTVHICSQSGVEEDPYRQRWHVKRTEYKAEDPAIFDFGVVIKFILHR